jgi:hypothetical protein
MHNGVDANEEDFVALNPVQLSKGQTLKQTAGVSASSGSHGRVETLFEVECECLV